MSKRTYNEYLSISNVAETVLCPTYLRVCAKCDTAGSKSPFQHVNDELLTLECLSCSSQWTICTKCGRGRKQMTNNNQITKHLENCQKMFRILIAMK